MTTPNDPTLSQTTTRRDFLRKSAVASGGALLAGLDIARFAHAQFQSETTFGGAFRLALIGCGQRGIAAFLNAVNNLVTFEDRSRKPVNVPVKLMAVADVSAERVTTCLKYLQQQCPRHIDVPRERQFVGFDAYQKAIPFGDMALLCTPPGFRPMQFEAAVAASKHVFMETPVAVDAPGFRRILAANLEAKKRGLVVAVGHHLRHSQTHCDAIKQVHEGRLGDLLFTRAYHNTAGVWNRPRVAGINEMQYQIHNWYHFIWLSGDHIVEQLVHGIDVCNWMAKGRPVEAKAIGGRQVRIAKDIGELFDHFAVEFTYASGVRGFAQCRHMPGCWDSVTHSAHGPTGWLEMDGAADKGVVYPKGLQPEAMPTAGVEGHQAEINDCFTALLIRKPYNELDWAAESTMTAIMGRMAAYSGKIVTWDEAVKSELSYAPDKLAWDAVPKSVPGPDGVYPCATPGVTKAL
ncbi:MAG: Gfo/Idh/MocA family oxidoreductase [Verrucomicrobia bacterium]|nr:Gfo/Idh/MocA family oxidoreductase [Verrucomicrobiota bacterium]